MIRHASIDTITIVLYSLNSPHTSQDGCQSHVTTDDQSVSKSWFRGPPWSHDRIFNSVRHLLFCRCRAPPLTRGRVCHQYQSPELLQFSNFAAGLYQLLYFGVPFVCLLHIEEAQALPPRQGSSPWGGQDG
jgi:hypothetical protein